MVCPFSTSRSHQRRTNIQSRTPKTWAAKIDSLDGFVFVTPEYNHSIPGSLKNAIDFVYKEWNNKAAGFVSYGTSGGVRAVEHLRGVMAEIQIADVRAHVSLSLFTDFENFSVCKPAERHSAEARTMLDQNRGLGNCSEAAPAVGLGAKQTS